MADKLGSGEVRELKLGASFTNNKASAFHTIKYDFKPASVDVNKMATVDVGTTNQVTVTVPHLDGAGIPQTVFRGNQRPYTKECVLIIDRVTGQITLEKLSSNIQVKKTRSESNHRPVPGLMPPAPPAPAVVPGPGPSVRPVPPAPAASGRPITPGAPAASGRPLTPAATAASGRPPTPAAPARPLTPAPSAPSHSRPNTPVEASVGNCTQRNSSRTRVASGARRNAGGASNAASGGAPSMYHGQLPRTPPSMVRSPQRVRTSPPQAAPWSGGQSTLASLPMIGLDDMSLGTPAPALPPVAPSSTMPNGFANTMIPVEPSNFANSAPVRKESDAALCAGAEAGVMSSSSSSSDSGSDSEASDSEADDPPRPALPHAATTAAGTTQQLPNLTNGTGSVRGPSLMNVLNDDLCLSESGSDSD